MLTPGSKYHHLIHAVRKLKAGEAYVATQGADFSCSPQSFAGVVYQAAETKGGGWKGTVVVLGDQVVYAFYRRDDWWRPNLPAYPLVKKYRGE